MNNRKIIGWTVGLGCLFQFTVWNSAMDTLVPGFMEPATSSPAPMRRAAPPNTASPSPDSPALKAALNLPVIIAHREGYDRDEFGPAWRDLDHNGCDQKNDVLRRDSVKRHTKPGTRGCVLQRAVVDHGDQYGYGKDDVIFERGNGKIEIDHTVSLADAWRSGAWAWEADKRAKFANDFMNLQSVDRATNRTKGDKTIVQWAPKNDVELCYFATRQVAIKKRYKLGVAEGERAAFTHVLGSSECEDMGLPRAREFKAPKPRPIGEPKPKATPPRRTPPPNTRQQPRPTEAPQRGVHPGAFCAPDGAKGVTVAGRLMVCKSTASDSRNRWR